MLFSKSSTMQSVIMGVFVVSVITMKCDAKETKNSQLEDDFLTPAETQNQTYFQVDLVVIPQPEEVIKMSTTSEGLIVEQVNSEDGDGDGDENSDRVPYIFGHVRPCYINGISHLFNQYFGADATEYNDQAEQNLIEKAQAIRELGIFTH